MNIVTLSVAFTQIYTTLFIMLRKIIILRKQTMFRKWDIGFLNRKDNYVTSYLIFINDQFCLSIKMVSGNERYVLIR